MRRVLFLWTCVLVAVFAAGRVRAGSCERNASAPDIRFVRKRAPVRIDHSFSRRKMEAYYKKRQGRHAIDSYHSPGFTEAIFGISFQIRTKGVPQRGKYCVHLDGVEVSYGYDALDIYIENSYPEGSCEYGAINGHEHDHVRIHRTALDFYAPYLKDKVRRVAATIKPVEMGRDGDLDAVTQQFSKQLHTEVMPMVNYFLEQRDRENAQLDSDTNYRYITSLCKNW